MSAKTEKKKIHALIKKCPIRGKQLIKFMIKYN